MPNIKNKYLPEINFSPFKSIESKIVSTNPDVLILYHESLNKDVSKYKDAFQITHPTIKKYILEKQKKQKENGERLTTFNEDFFIEPFVDKNNKTYGLFKDVREEYEFNGNTYVLDSVLVKNGDKSIIGFTYEGEKYVYNNFSSNPDCPCSIKKFDWKYNNGKYCYHPYKCDLNDNLEDIGDLCFDFKEGNKTLIYIKKSKKEEINEDIGDEELLALIEEIQRMKQADLIGEIKKFDKTIIRDSSIDITELQRIYLRYKLTNKQIEEVKIEEVKTEE
jgi:hypothetical protein